MKLTCLFFLSIGLIASYADAKEWKTSIGRAFEAEFVQMDDDHVIFVLPSGQKFRTPLKSLGQEEQLAIIKDQAEKKGSVQNVLRKNMENDSDARYGSNWPREVRLSTPVQPRVVSEDKKASKYIYESTNFRFICNAELQDDIVRHFSTLFETTFNYSRSLPIGMNGGLKRENRLDVVLLSEYEDYIKLGGPVNSAACYVGSSGHILAPLASLGVVRNSDSFTMDLKRSNFVLIHEIAHQLTPQAYFLPGARGWFSEGLAEYIAITPYNWSYFAIDIYGNAVKQYVTAEGTRDMPGRRLGTKLTVPPLRNFMLQDYASFSSDKNANYNYGIGLLLTYYFFHMESSGKPDKINSFLKALREGKQGEEAIAVLLSGRTYEKLQAEISAAWAKKGIEITFGK